MKQNLMEITLAYIDCWNFGLYLDFIPYFDQATLQCNIAIYKTKITLNMQRGFIIL